jgi:hypothetical protein
MKSIRSFPAIFAVFATILLPVPTARAMPATDPVNVFADTGSLQTARRDHTATLLQDGAVLVAGGYNGSYLASAELYNPALGTWSNVGNLATARRNHTATFLPDGTVLVVGGRNAGILSSAQIYDPRTQVWQSTEALATARYQHTATLLPDGTVLVVGGTGVSGDLASAEIYHPDTRSWTAAASLTSARTSHTATFSAFLEGGYTGVLVAGGSSGATFPTGSEFYNFTTQAWLPAGILTTGRSGHTATLNDQGTIVVAGGTGSSGSLASVESGVANGTTSTSLTSARSSHTATRLPDGRILFTGGLNGGTYLSSAETTGVTSGSLRFVRASHTATLLTSGKVLIVGGYNGTSYLSSAELFDPDAATWSSGPALTTARGSHTATLLSNGKVLVAGGVGATSNKLATTELFDPAANGWSPTGALATARRFHTGTLLRDGTVLVAGGEGAGGSLSSSEIYDPITGTWRADIGPLSSPRTAHTATLLPSGKVLVAGGGSNTAELYNPATGGWQSTGATAVAHTGHTATLLPDGTVLVVGGGNSTAELYNPVTGTWSSTGSFGSPVSGQTATLLSIAKPGFQPFGKVLVVGSGTARPYDTYPGSWGGAVTMVTAQRYGHTATLLSNGTVLITGGHSTTASLASSSFYDPTRNAWITTGDLAGARESHTATLLLDGRVLAVGGFNGSVAVSTVEVFDPGVGGVSQPDIGTATLADGVLALTGTRLNGWLGSSGSGGNSQDSSTAYPLVQCRSLANDETAWLSFEGSTTIQADGLRGSLASFPGAGLMRVTVFSNGTPSASAIIANLHSDTAYAANYTAGQTAGQNAVTSSPNSFNLYSQSQYAANYTAGQNTVLAAPDTFDLYSLSQVQALNVGTPLIRRDGLGQFKLTFGVEKSTTLQPGSFLPFPMTAPQTSINAQGKLEFRFTSPDNAAFFRLESH